ncbi:hypothetical protein [Bremerella alba]|uniref:Transmembrane protein n=1 Tax=Bremerella alba TaxID=980252 RepID=A0A7V8V5N5_9BACT|nr:hypothetical protein [Bremerella alba]MBA2115429.1 hypothetical protein [Bremerella alba]
MTDLAQEEPWQVASTDSSLTGGSPTLGSKQPHRKGDGWILAPWLDLFLIANIFWPLLVLVQLDEGVSGRTTIEFWQIYFITTPHRWSTLGLVLLDRNPYRANPRFMFGFAAVVILLCIGIWVGTGALTCLLTIDYLWNAWHFASQHHGIYRIYGRLAGVTSLIPGWLEKMLLRTFMLYCILRVAQLSVRSGTMSDVLSIIDYLAPILPCVVLVDCLVHFQRNAVGRMVYLVSVIGIFSGMLWAVHIGYPAMVLTLATASAWFHASEYLSVVGWRMQKQSGDGTIHSRDRIFRWVASRWIFSLLIFVIILGSCGWLLEHRFLEYWLLLNVIVAFLHYGYDGLLWKKNKANSVETIRSK